MLYLSTGDGGTQGDPEGDAQSLGSLLGKILRLDVGIPPSAIDRVAPRLRTQGEGAASACCACAGRSPTSRCSENCSVVAGGRLHVGKREYRLQRVRHARRRPNKRVRVKVPLGAKAREAIAGGPEASPQGPRRREPARPRRDRQPLEAGHRSSSASKR